MLAMTIINGHQSDVPSDANKKLYVEGAGSTVGGAHDTYNVAHSDGPGTQQLDFMTAQRAGLTNEVLLAIVADRLYSFQGGQFPCEENAVALSHVNCALAALKERTRRVHLTKRTTGVPRPPHAKGRLYREAFTVWIGDASYDVTDRDAVEEAIRRLTPPIQPYEIPDDCLVTDRLTMFKDTTTMPDDKKDEKPRVRLDDDGMLCVGSYQFTAASLKTWNTWSTVERAAKKLDPPLTAAEMEIVEKSAAHLGGGARNGLAEFKSAMASTRKA